jgi:lysophospholipase L1-like esterase/pimeloyl-ACP methyl ester carboxylesterase
MTLKATTMSKLTFVLAAVVAVGVAHADDHEATWFDQKTVWNGYERFHFKVADRAAYLVAPKRPAQGNPWVWRARFPDYHAEMDKTLLARGYHVGYVDVAGLFGSPDAVSIGDEFYKFLTESRGLSRRPCLEGVSRGGLFVYNWAAENAEKVACIYCDTPVCDFKSWPGGKGGGLGSAATWQQCLKAYGLNEEQALQFDENPIDHAAVIAKAKIPLLHIVSENDRVVPPAENTYLLQGRIEQHGHNLNVISVPIGTAESNGHHFDHPDPDRVVTFIAEHTGTLESSPQELLRGSPRIVFLGDSITYAGHYVAFFDAWLLTQKLDKSPVVIDVGLPSETVSGLSEDGHAGGRFPRPDLAERLERVLSVTKPNLVLACYGINCGIYQPFDEERFHRYQQGIETLKQRVEAVGARLVLVTPPFYDDQRAKKSFSYNSVLDRYAQWLLAQREKGWLVIDLHGPMAREVAQRREKDPDFTFQPDGVHPNAEGHWFMAQQLIRGFGDENAAGAASPQEMLAGHEIPNEVLRLVQERMNLLRDAYVGAAGHKRPGIRAGLPIEKAEQRAEKITAQILKQREKAP